MGERIDAFLNTTFPAFLEALTQEAVASAAGALAREVLEPPKSTLEEFAAAWGEVSGHTLAFSRAQERAAALAGVTREALLGLWRALSRSPPLRVQVQGGAAGANKSTV